MASPNHTIPVLQSSNHEIKQTLLRSPPSGQQSLLPVPTYRRRPNLPLVQRSIIETNFAYQTTPRPSCFWSWKKTEKYVHYKDTLMLECLHDYPVVEWVIEAQEARDEEVASFYAEGTTFSWWIRGEPAPIDDNLSISNEVDVVDNEQEKVEEVEEMEVEQRSATPEPIPASPEVPQMADPAASEEDQILDQSQEATTETPTVVSGPRRSTRVAQQKLKEEHDQQVKSKPIDPDPPRTLQTRKPITLPKRSKQKSVQSKQQENQRPRRRSTRVSAKRTFADEPWSAPRDQSN